MDSSILHINTEITKIENAKKKLSSKIILYCGRSLQHLKCMMRNKKSGSSASYKKLSSFLKGPMVLFSRQNFRSFYRKDKASSSGLVHRYLDCKKDQMKHMRTFHREVKDAHDSLNNLKTYKTSFQLSIPE